MRGSLTIVGTGIQAINHITHEARVSIEKSEKVLFLLADPVSEIWIKKLNPTAESLFYFYAEGKPRIDSYIKMVEHILKYVREGSDVCVVFYGHPGVFVFPSHEALKRARLEGHSARMLPAISSEDCLFADLGIDPARTGCQSFEATDFLIHRRKFDTSSSLILWQIGVVGYLDYTKKQYRNNGLAVLVEVLEEHYGSDHETVIYEAAEFTVCKPFIKRTSLAKLSHIDISPISTLYVPPKTISSIDKNMLTRLGIDLLYPCIDKTIGKR